MNIRTAGLALALLSLSAMVTAQGKAQGGCVVRDTEHDGPAPIYRSEDGAKVEAWANRGDCFGGVTTVGLARQYQFEHKGTRVHILYLTKGVSNPRPLVNAGIEATAWMEAADLDTFLYDCGCGFGKHHECGPTALEGWVDRTWNLCFQQARDSKLHELTERWAQPASTSTPAKTATRVEPAALQGKAEKPLTNNDVIKMLTAGLGDDLTVAKIKQAPSVDFDVSADALVQLKKAGASKAVIDSVMKRASKPNAQ